MPRKKNKVSFWAIPTCTSIILLIAALAFPLFYTALKSPNTENIKSTAFSFGSNAIHLINNGILFDVISYLMIISAAIISIYGALTLADYKKFSKTDILARLRGIVYVLFVLVLISIVILSIILLATDFSNPNSPNSVGLSVMMHCHIGFFLYILGAAIFLICSPIEIYRRIKY